ncbi:MAG: VWA domain-containing protein [Rhodospirillaceae bacterium]|nr:VWA domain-containing protein [Rhodospirillaceae bacterium]
MSGWTFASPWLLFLLPAAVIPALLPYLWQRQWGPVGMRYSDTRLIAGKSKSLRLRVLPFVPVLRVLALALVIVGAARPQSGDAREVIRGEGVDIAIALDISGSMGVTDFEPHRLGAAKEIIADFIAARKYDRIGLVVFSREAFIQSPPTLDHQVLLRLLRDVHLTDEMGIEDGTAMGNGMATAANMLKDSTAESKLVTLITDGANNAGELDPITVATAAEALGIKLYTIGVGRSDGAGAPQVTPSGSEGVTQESPLDEETLRQIAELTNAQFYRATDTAGLRDIYAEIDALEKSEIEVLRFTRYQELAAWFLVPALALLLLDLVLTRTVFRKMP